MVLVAAGTGNVERSSLAGRAGSGAGWGQRGGRGVSWRRQHWSRAIKGFLRSWPLGSVGTRRNCGGRVAPKHRACKERKKKSEPQKHLLRGAPGLWFVSPTGPQIVQSSLSPRAQPRPIPFFLIWKARF